MASIDNFLNGLLRCAKGRAFNSSGTIQQSITMTCGWDKQWTPVNSIPHCSCE